MLSLMRGVNAVDGRAITAKSIGQATRHPPDCRYADASEVMNSAVWEPLFKVFNDLPAIHECLELCRGAQILEKITALSNAPEADDGFKQGVFCACLLSFGFVSIGLHGCISVLTC